VLCAEEQSLCAKIFFQLCYKVRPDEELAISLYEDIWNWSTLNISWKKLN